MTCIIGSRCSDGVVLIADRKVSYPSRPPEYIDKLVSPYTPFVFGSSGSVGLFQRFLDDALKEAQEIHRSNVETTRDATSGAVFQYPTQDPNKAIEVRPYLNKLEEVISRISDKYRSSAINFEILLAVRTHDSGSILYHFPEQSPAEKVFRYKPIGSGQPFSEVFLRPSWKKEMNMMDVARMAYFVIKFIETFELDTAVGVDGQHPQVWFVYDYNDPQQAWNNLLEEFKQDADKRLEKIRRDGMYNPVIG